MVHDLGLDSVDLLMLILAVEAHLGAELPPITVEPTLANLYELVTSHAHQAAKELGQVSVEIE